MISVIIPVYNVENYIVDCLESVVNQTVPFEQIIIINDGSTDKSMVICEEYRKNHPNIQIFTQKNEGQGVARNKGVEYVKSEYLIFLDSDDYVVENTVERLQYWIKKENLDIVYYDTDILIECTETSGTFTGQTFTNHYDRVGKIESVVMRGKEYFFQNYPEWFPVSPCMACFKTSLLKERQITFPSVRAHEDEFFSVVAAVEAELVQYVPERLYMRRFREGSTTTVAFDIKRLMSFWTVFEARWRYYASRKEYWTAEESEFLRYYMWMTYYNKRSFMDYVLMDKASLAAFERYQASFCEAWGALSDNRMASRMFCKKCLGLYLGLDKPEEAVLRREFKAIAKRLKEDYSNNVKEVLKKLPFSKKNVRVGIYGTGYHTEQLLLWYRLLCGEINCELYFIDTYKDTGTIKYMERPMINVADAKEYVDYIVISSSKYETEMKDKVVALFEETIPVFCFYEEDKEPLFINYEKFQEMVE